MSIQGQQFVNIGQPNKQANSDSLYQAFTTINNNFNMLFANASPITTLVPGDGIAIGNSSNSTYKITNTGVTKLLEGRNITITNFDGVPASTGNLIINADFANVGNQIAYGIDGGSSESNYLLTQMIECGAAWAVYFPSQIIDGGLSNG